MVTCSTVAEATTFPSVLSLIIKLPDIASSHSLFGACLEPDLFDRTGNLLRGDLFRIERYVGRSDLNGIHLNSFHLSQSIGNPSYTSSAMHPFNRQCNYFPHPISPFTE